MSSGEAASRWRNTDPDWDRWPVPVYLAENYRNLHESDGAVIAHHSAAYRELAAGSLGRAVEIGTGPNLYPLFLASGAADASTPSIAARRGSATSGGSSLGTLIRSGSPSGTAAVRSTPPCRPP